MASWIDVFSLVLTTLFFVGSVVGILYVVRGISLYLQSMKTSLENKGITISRDGVALKTRKRFDRDTYVDATQRGFVKALGAATVGPKTRKRAFLPHSQPSVDGVSTGIPTGDEQEKSLFGWMLRRSPSDARGEER